MCGVWGRMRQARTRSVCCIDLCDICGKDVMLQSVNPGNMAKPDVRLSPLRAGSQKEKVCAKCMAEADLM